MARLVRVQSGDAKGPAGIAAAIGEGVRATRVGLRLPARLSFADWERAGTQLTRIMDASSWCLGDWIAYGEAEYATRYRRAVDAVGLNYQTLRNYAWVARRFAVSRRRERLSFQHHMEVARLPDAEQDRWLDAATDRGWSVRQLRQCLRAGGPDGVAHHGPTALPRITAAADRLERWRSAASMANSEFTAWVTASLDRAASQILDPAAGRP